MSLALPGANAGDLARLIDRRPVRVSRRSEDWWFPDGRNSRGVSTSAAGFWSARSPLPWLSGSGPGEPGWVGVSSLLRSSPRSLRPRTCSGKVSFPIYPSRTALLFVSSALALVFYFPTLFVLSVIARPGFEPDGTGSGFLVNCWAYHGGARAARRPVDLDETSPPRRAAGRPSGRGFGSGGRMDRATVAGRWARLSAALDPAFGGLASGVPVQGPVRPDLGRARR